MRDCFLLIRGIENSGRNFQIRGFSIEHDEFLLIINRHQPGFDKTCAPESMLEGRRKASGVREFEGGLLQAQLGQ